MIHPPVAVSPLRALLGALLALALSAAALAQPFGGGGGGGPFGGGEMLQPGVSRQDMERYAQRLSLDDDQREAAMLLLEGYQAVYNEEAAVIRERMEAIRDEFRETRDPSVWRDFGESMRAFAQRREAMEADLMGDIRVLLTEEQAAAWPRFEMQRRRESTIRQGLMSGEAVDLVRLVDDMGLEPAQREALNDLLARYEQELDPALVARNRVYADGRDRGGEMFRGGDMEGMQDMFTRAREASTRVREINRRFARQVQATLPDDLRPRFDAEFRKRSFPMVFREGPAERALASVATMEDLTPEQRETFDAARSRFERELTAIRDRWVKAQEEFETESNLEEVMFRGRRGGMPGREERRERARLEERTIERLADFLTPEQLDRLPREETRAGDEDAPGGPRMRPGGGRERGRDRATRRESDRAALPAHPSVA